MATFDTLRYTRATLVVADVLTRMMRDLLTTKASPSNLDIMTSQMAFQKLLQKHEKALIGTLKKSYLNELDIGLIYKIIRHFTFIQAPSRGWGYAPTAGDITIADDIERIRIVRNSLMHRPNPVLTEPQLDSMFAGFKDVSHRFDAHFDRDVTNGYQTAVDEYRTGPIDPESEKKYRGEIYKIKEKYSSRNQNRNINIYFGRDVQDMFTPEGVQADSYGDTKLKVYLPGVIDPATVTKILTSMIMEIVQMNYEIILDNVGAGSLVLYLTVPGRNIQGQDKFLKDFEALLLGLIIRADISFSAPMLVEAIIVISDPLIDYSCHEIYKEFYYSEDDDTVGTTDEGKYMENDLLCNSFEQMTFTMPAKPLKPQEIEALLLKEATKQNSKNIEDELRLIMIGKTGVGKSAVGNFICGIEEFQSNYGARSVTQYCKHGKTIFRNRPVLIIDTPGIFDTEHESNFVENEIRKCIGMGAPGPHGILFVMTLSDRFKHEDNSAFREFLKFFGKSMLSYVIVVFTHADVLQSSGKTLDDHLSASPKQLKELLKSCGNRYISLNCKSTELARENQLNALFSMIKNLSPRNFEDENFIETEQLLIRREEEISAEVERRLQKMEEKMKKESEERLYKKVKARENVLTKGLLNILHPIQKEAIERLITVRDEIRTEIEHDQSQFVLNGSKLKMDDSITRKFSD